MTPEERLLRAVQGPLDSAKDLTGRGMGGGKDRDDCTPGEVLARGVWHALHYVERYLTGWDDTSDREAWERTTTMFVDLAEARTPAEAAVLIEAADLLADTRYRGNDRSLAMSWGRRRKALLDRAVDAGWRA